MILRNFFNNWFFRFGGSTKYWERRYRKNRTSGIGSYGKYASYKADILNAFCKQHFIQSVIDFGCGDGNQLSYADYPRYTGLDVSEAAVEICRTRFAHDKSKQFCLLPLTEKLTAELVLSLDVIYHLTEDMVFEDHIRDVFSSAERFVAIYSSDSDELTDPGGDSMVHIRHRNFTGYVSRAFPNWKLKDIVRNIYPECIAHFHFYEKS